MSRLLPIGLSTDKTPTEGKSSTKNLRANLKSSVQCDEEGRTAVVAGGSIKLKNAPHQASCERRYRRLRPTRCWAAARQATRSCSSLALMFVARVWLGNLNHSRSGSVARS